MAKEALTKQELKRLAFVRELPYVELIEAHKIIERGADHALLYMWYNLLKCNYQWAFTIEMVEKQVLYYCQRNPEFEGDLINWFNQYIERIKANANPSVKATA